MTAGAIIGLIVVLIITVAMNKWHREETGGNMPSRGAMRALRRRARKQGITEEEAYNRWVERKQKKLASDITWLPSASLGNVPLAHVEARMGPAEKPMPKAILLFGVLLGGAVVLLFVAVNLHQGSDAYLVDRSTDAVRARPPPVTQRVEQVTPGGPGGAKVIQNPHWARPVTPPETPVTPRVEQVTPGMPDVRPAVRSKVIQNPHFKETR